MARTRQAKYAMANTRARSPAASGMAAAIPAVPNLAISMDRRRVRSPATLA
nr:hypothetical protein [Acrocarpospora phusangensis]